MTPTLSSQQSFNQNGSSASGNNDPVAFLDAEKRRIIEGTEILKKELMLNWQKRNAGKKIFPDEIAKANPFAVDFLLSFSLVGVYDEIAKKCSLDEKQRDAVPRAIWRAFLNQNLSGIAEKIAEELNLQSPLKETFTSLIKEKIINKLNELNLKKFSPEQLKNSVAPSSVEKDKSNAVKMSLKSAMDEYKEIGDQLITSAPLKLRVFPEPVRPSVKNWITDYHDHLGSGKHGTIERGNFLFHSNNGKKLNSQERRRLAEVLKALNEETEVKVDEKNKRLVFENYSEVQKVSETDRSQVQAQIKSTQPESGGFQSKTSFKISNPDINKNVKTEKFYINEPKTTNDINLKQGGSVSNKIETRDNTQEQSKEALNRNIGSFSISKESSPILTEENYEIEENIGSSEGQSLKKSWNPAESVRRRMEDETGFLPLKKKNESVDIEKEMEKKISFSSPQVFPVEKKDKIEEAKETENNSRKPVQLHDDLGNDDLMERIRQINKMKSKNVKSDAVFRITPMGFSKKANTEGINNDDNLKNIKNIVDLKN